MTDQVTGPTKDRRDSLSEPKAFQRVRAFMQERLITGETDENGELEEASGQDLPKRSDQIKQYRSLQALHNPVFPGAENDGNGGNAGGGVDEGLLIGDQRIEDSLLPGHFYPIGPSALIGGQANTNPIVSGRITTLAIGNDGKRIYAGAANGGIWRSDNGGTSWRPLMNAIHLAPTTAQSDSLAIGAVVMDPDQPDRIFVGTGEGPGKVSISGAPEFFGIGPLYSQDGGYSWQEESVGDTRLSGSAFFRMLIDPDDDQKVTAASRHGVMQRQPRNRKLKTAFKPQAYFFRYSLTSWDLSTYFWNEDGVDTTQAWTGGGGYLTAEDWLTPFVFNGIPYYLLYNSKSGLAELDLWEGDGSPSHTLTSGMFNDNWGKNWSDLMPVTLMGKAYILTYRASSGLATLWFLDIRNEVLFYEVEKVWQNRDWGKGWTNFIPITILGQPYFVAYDLRKGAATLQYWLPNGENIRVWRKTWPLRLRIMAFTIQAESFFLWVSTLDGSGQLNRWNSDGSYDSVREFDKGTFTKSLNLQLIPYELNGESRFMTYNLNNGAMNGYRWTSDLDIELLESQQWDRDLITKAFNMGFEWIEPEFDPKPSASASLPEPDTPTASGLAMAQSAGVAHYYAAFWDNNVYRSTDGGANWSVLGTGFPSKAGRVTLASQCDNQDVLYAFLQEGQVYRWDSTDNKWRKISGVPAKDKLVGGQGGYDLAMDVSPNDVDTIYLGGSTIDGGAALYRCKVNYSKGTVFNSVSMIPTWIGSSVHADVHAIDFTECSPDNLWIGCDGGVFFTSKATSKDPTEIAEMFKPKNCGLGTQTVNYLGQHPREDAILFCGTQDNGGQLMIGSEAWKLASYGDCGHVLINWSEPKEVLLSYISNKYSISSRGGQSPTGNVSHTIPDVKKEDSLFYPPFASTPVESAISPNSKRIAYGSKRPWVNDDFGNTDTDWTGLTTANLGSDSGFRIKSMVFVTPKRLLIGLINGRVYRFDEDTSADPVRWDNTRLDTVGQGLPVKGPITGIAPDPNDNSNVKFFVTIGGSVDDYRRVWYFDGTGWVGRSGPEKDDINALLDVQYNAIAAVKIDTDMHLFAGADIGLWHSQDSGDHWRPFSVGLPETAIFDLKIFPEDQTVDRPWLLRAATYGRSVYERVIAGGTVELQASLVNSVQLYIKTNILDRGLYPASTRTVTGYVNNINQSDIRLSVDMKMLKSEDGSFSQPAEVDFCEFESFQNQNFNEAKPIQGRFYIRVHTRGGVIVDDVNIRLLMAKVDDIAEPVGSASLMPNLPVNLVQLIKTNQPVPSNSGWENLGTTTVNGLFAGTPLVASMDFPLTQKGSYFVLAILNQTKDPFADPQRNALTLITNNRKAALSYFIVDF